MFESKQINPKKKGCLHFLRFGVLVAVAVPLTVAGSVRVIVSVDIGGFVIELCTFVRLGWAVVGSGSQQPKKKPGVSHVSLSFAVLVGVLLVDVVVVEVQPPPNQPGLHVVDLDAVIDAGTDSDVRVGGSVVVVTVMFARSLQPNQPGLTQVVVVYVVVTTIWVEVVPVVLSSRQPHQPGVLQVDVLVYVVLVVVVVVVVVVLSEPLLSKYFQLKQSTHS